MMSNRITLKTPPVWVLILLALAMWGGEYARRKLWEPDEARYAYVAREMREGGHWLVPHVNGGPYPDKPPLMFWLINASSLLTGGRINSVSARLPSLLGAILTLWAVTRLLARWRSAAAAWRAMLVLITSFLFRQEGGWGRIDALLCGLVMLSIYFLFSSLEERRAGREFLAYIFGGLAVLAKGPVGLAVPMGIFAVSAWSGGQGRKLKRWHWLWGPAVALTIPSLWLLFAWHGSGGSSDYFKLMLGEKCFHRVVESDGHSGTVLYYLWHFPLEFMPWTIFLPAAVRSLPNRALRKRLLGWLVFVIAFFSLFTTKRNVYILSAYPAAAMLIGAAWDDMAKLPSRWQKATGYTAIGLVCLLAAATTIAVFVPGIPFKRLSLIPAACVAIAGAALLVRFYRRDGIGDRWFLLFCSVFFLFQIAVYAVAMPAMNELKTPLQAVDAVKQRLPRGQPVYLYRQQLAIFPFYTERPGREIHSVNELIGTVSSSSNTIVVFGDDDWRELQPELGGFGEAHEFVMGHKSLVWVEFPDTHASVPAQKARE